MKQLGQYKTSIYYKMCSAILAWENSTIPNWQGNFAIIGGRIPLIYSERSPSRKQLQKVHILHHNSGSTQFKQAFSIKRDKLN